jgi:hypothetical protein
MLDAAADSAATLEMVYGPLMVLDREGLEDLASTAPATNGSEWVEDQAGMLLKWGAAISAAAPAGWLPDKTPDGLLWQLPSDAARRPDGPLIMSGRADLVRQDWLTAAGMTPTPRRLPAGYRLGFPSSADLRREDRVHLPERVAVEAAEGTWIGYDSDGSPLLGGRDGMYYWQPPDLADPGNPLVPHSQIGSVSPYIEAARLLAREARASGGLATDEIAAHEPVTIGCWRSGGRLHVLLGNLESGWMGDSRFRRSVSLVLPASHLECRPGAEFDVVSLNTSDPTRRVRTEPDCGDLHLVLTVAPSGCLVVRLEPLP